jgi:hypothetical protein
MHVIFPHKQGYARQQFTNTFQVRNVLYEGPSRLLDSIKSVGHNGEGPLYLIGTPGKDDRMALEVLSQNCMSACMTIEHYAMG